MVAGSSGLSEEERVAVQNYLSIFIREKEAQGSAVIDRVHSVFLDLLSKGKYSEMLRPFIDRLFNEDAYEGSARGLLFLLRSFCLLSEGEAVEVHLFNKIALLLVNPSDNPVARGFCIFKGLSDLLKENCFPEKHTSFVWNYSAPPLSIALK